ncbi:hypothetical protein Mmol_0874 [Methylotenera mobilis JLW8]|uniref:Uncharacterized protein n=1 Tax=Methylotenera mobilis (strain JLW8 / ATCC BAA-1282 / DSM 17540) TaxID=583345 RepID=C6WV34_METML|nr:hypothetical protein Mmol_0874 [Methylotenera mobilis JLW8]
MQILQLILITESGKTPLSALKVNKQLKAGAQVLVLLYTCVTARPAADILLDATMRGFKL